MAIQEAPYQDPALPVEERVADLLQRMTLEEKAGQLFHNMITTGPDGSLAGPVPAMGILDTRALLEDKKMAHFNLVGPVADARLVAAWHNTLQQHVLDHTRLGIPVTLSTDPRHHVSPGDNVGTGFRAGAMSRWPETFGLGALRDPGLVHTFADCVRREYAAVGLRVALHPQADLATEYRWARVASTFGEDAELASKLVAAYIEGLQGPLRSGSRGDGRDSVSAMTKHFPGVGPELDGEDSHFNYGREQAYPGEKFEYHLEPFREAIAAGTRQIMPSYAMPIGTKYEQVGFAFNKGVITDILRSELGFEGIVCTDWGLITDAVLLGQDMPARAWGCEKLSELERVVKIIDAGCDQLGGESRPELVVEAVRSGLVAESRIDQSVRRILTEKFVLGLFDDRRFVDVEKAATVVGNPKFMQLGRETQRRAFTILVNENAPLPIPQQLVHDSNIYVEGLQGDSAAQRGLNIVTSPAEADIALLRLQAPYEARPGGFEAMFHAGSLEFPQCEVVRLSEIIRKVRLTVIDVYLDRPAVLTPLVDVQRQVNEQRRKDGNAAPSGSALVVNFGADDEAFLDVCFGVGDVMPQGMLPFDLPRSMEAASRAREDVPFDTEDALFKFGIGLRYQD